MDQAMGSVAVLLIGTGLSMVVFAFTGWTSNGRRRRPHTRKERAGLIGTGILLIVAAIGMGLVVSGARSPSPGQVAAVPSISSPTAQPPNTRTAVTPPAPASPTRTAVAPPAPTSRTRLGEPHLPQHGTIWPPAEETPGGQVTVSRRPPPPATRTPTRSTTTLSARPSGRLLAPAQETTVGDLFCVRGELKSLEPGHVGWLAVRLANGDMWPKDQALNEGPFTSPDIDHQPDTATPQPFTLLLLDVTSEGSTYIDEWMRSSRARGSWPPAQLPSGSYHSLAAVPLQHDGSIQRMPC
jgi:hypothetical protein